VSLLVVRHGQASAGSDDYDCLSGAGTEQCRRLGRWLAATGQEFDAVVVGGMKRHAQSAAAIAEGYARHAERALPAGELDAGLDEFDHHAVFNGFSGANLDHAAVRGAAAGGLQALAPLIRAALGAWAEDAIEGVPESWQAFGERVALAGGRLAGRGEQRLLVVTSGGVAARLAQAALDAPRRVVIDLSLSLRNSGLSEFHRREGGLALGSWNALPHLHDARELWTYY
jgi:broad specificity phosphatase PhoE